MRWESATGRSVGLHSPRRQLHSSRVRSAAAHGVWALIILLPRRAACASFVDLCLVDMVEWSDCASRADDVCVVLYLLDGKQYAVRMYCIVLLLRIRRLDSFPSPFSNCCCFSVHFIAIFHTEAVSVSACVILNPAAISIHLYVSSAAVAWPVTLGCGASAPCRPRSVCHFLSFRLLSAIASSHSPR